MTDTVLEIILILILIFLNGLFALSELALLSARRPRLQQYREDGDKRAGVALDLLENPNQLLSTVQIGITLVGIFSGALGGATLGNKLNTLLSRISWLAGISSQVSIILIVLSITYLSLVLGELIPKRLALSNPERFALVMARPMATLSWVVRPVVWLLSKSTELGVHAIGMKASTEPVVTEEEIRILLEEGANSGIFEEVEQDIVESVFRFADRTVDAIMTSRMDIIWLDIEDSFEEIVKQIIASDHTVFPVAQGSLDGVLGILSVKDLFAAVYQEKSFDIKYLIKQPFYAPQNMPALKVLEEVKRSGVPVALVIDEFGGVLGMVTPQDILKAFVGQIPDAGQEAQPQAVQREDGSWLFDGLLRVDEMKEILDLDDLPDEEHLGYQTVGGMIMSTLGVIPNPGQYMVWHGLKFEVVDMDGHRVDKVLVSPVNFTQVEPDQNQNHAG